MWSFHVTFISPLCFQAYMQLLHKKAMQKQKQQPKQQHFEWLWNPYNSWRWSEDRKLQMKNMSINKSDFMWTYPVLFWMLLGRKFYPDLIHMEACMKQITIKHLFKHSKCLFACFSVVDLAISVGRLDILERLKVVPIDKNTSICTKAAECGQWHILKWARANRFPWDEETCACAAKNGHLHILKWVRKRYCPWNSSTCENAARHGHLHVLEWARKNNCPWDEKTCAAAARCNLNVLRWARERKCPWDSSTLQNAIIKGDLETVKWIKDQDGPWSDFGAIAAANGHLEILQWFEAQNIFFNKLNCLVAARCWGHFHIMEWFQYP